MAVFYEAKVVEPVEDRAAYENARLVNELRVALLRSGTAVSIESVAAATGRSAATVRRWVARARDGGRFVTVTHDGQILIPTFQLTDAFDDVDPDAGDLVARLTGAGLDPWSVWDWMLTSNTWLDGDRPIDLFDAGELGPLERAVAGLSQE